MLLSDGSLMQLIFQSPTPLLSPCDPSQVNPASVDIRVGKTLKAEKVCARGEEQDPINWLDVDMEQFTKEKPLYIGPGQLLLVSTLERIVVPGDCALELRLKSSTARNGWDHMLAFWFDPGWDGVGTMELKNCTLHHELPIWYGQRIAQVILHKLDQPALHPYNGKYQRATTVEAAKS